MLARRVSSWQLGECCNNNEQIQELLNLVFVRGKGFRFFFAI